jgi:hypothetical protein
MRALAACAVVWLMVAGVDALAQADEIERLRLRVCSVFPPAERVECLKKLTSDPDALPSKPTPAPTEAPPPKPTPAPAAEAPPPKPAPAPAAEAPPPKPVPAPAAEAPPPKPAPASAAEAPPPKPTPAPAAEAPPPKPAPAPAAEAPPPGETWIVSQTTSPFDDSPIAIATASTGSRPTGVPLQLSIQCRGGGTELVLMSAPIKPRGEGYAVAYRIDDGGPLPLATGAPASGTGVAIKGDVVRLLASLPDRGSVSFRITAPQGETLEGRYSLAGLNAALRRLAGPCKWPAASQPSK